MGLEGEVDPGFGQHWIARVATDRPTVEPSQSTFSRNHVTDIGASVLQLLELLPAIVGK